MKEKQLSPRERQVVELLLQGCENDEIAKQLNITPRTVKAYLNRLFLRFGINSGVKRVKLATLLYRKQLFSDRDTAPEPRRDPELRIIELVAQGLTNKDVAGEIGSTESALKNCVRRIYDKLGLWNRVELALWYLTRRHEELVQNAPAC